MKIYIPIGDWSDDGHGKCEKFLVDAPSLEHIYEAQKKAKAAGFDFENNWCADYEDADIHVADADLLNEYGYDGCVQGLSPDELMKAFVYILNKFGADITMLDSEEEIPELNNWTCPGFENVGYGCFGD